MPAGRSRIYIIPGEGLAGRKHVSEKLDWWKRGEEREGRSARYVGGGEGEDLFRGFADSHLARILVVILTHYRARK